MLGYIVAIVMAIFLVFWGVKWRLTTPLTIEFPYKKIDWLIPILFTNLSFLVIFMLDYSVVRTVSSAINVEKSAFLWLKVLLDNGFIIPIYCIVLSRIFEGLIEALYLDYLEFYSPLVSKICFSFMVIAVCVKMLVSNKLLQIDTADYSLVCEIMMWVLSILGTWFGFGFNCEGRIERENRKRRDIRNNVSAKDKISFWFPIGIAIAISCALIFSDLVIVDLSHILYFLTFDGSLIIFALISLGIVNSKLAPNVKKSKRNFDRFVKMDRRGLEPKGQYGRMKYSLKGRKLVIDSVEVKYDECDEKERKELKRLFGYHEEPVTDYDECLNFLEKRNKDQNDFIKECREKCIENKANKKRESYGKIDKVD